MMRVCVSVGLLAFASGQNPHPDLGGYKPASNVVEHAQMVYDVKDITNYASSGDFAAAKAVYTGGKYSCKSTSNTRKFQGFVSQATVDSKLRGEAFFDSFTGGNGPVAALGVMPGRSGAVNGMLSLSETFWDDFMIGALDGTGSFDGLDDDVRKMAVKKGILGVLTLYTTHELESAINKAHSGNTADTQAPHAWDEGWAFYYGSYTTAGKYSAWEFTKKRDLDYAYDANNARVSGTVEAKVEILDYFLYGLRASRTGTVSVSEMIEARDNIYRMLALSSIRAALKYAYKAQNPSYSAAYQMEGYAYWLAAAGWVDQASPGVGQAVLNLFDFTKNESQLDSDLYCAVKAALIPAYGPLGLDCTMVGVFKSLPSSKSCSNLPACPSSTTLPEGLSSYVPNTTTTAGSDVECGASISSASTSTSSGSTSTGNDEETDRASYVAKGLALPLALGLCLW
jgi:hypothetical protein